MSIDYRLKKEATPYAVATSKMPIWLFENLEKYKETNNLPSRNCALNILVALALCDQNYITSEEFQEYFESQYPTIETSHLVSNKKDPSGKGGITDGSF